MQSLVEVARFKWECRYIWRNNYSFTDKVGLLKQVEEIVAAAVGEAVQDAKYYLKAMTSAHTAKDFIANELARLERMISSGSLSPKKKDEFTRKKNVLAIF